MTTELDPEILFAAALGVTMAKMRAELDDPGIKRVIRFVLDRYGIEPRQGDVYIRTMPPARVSDVPQADAEPYRVAVRPAPQEAEDPPVPLPPTNNKPTCPVCAWSTITEKGVTLHMWNKHGVTLKEHARMKALDDAPVTKER